MTPEQKSRQNIDTLLIQAGFIVQNRDEFDRTADRGVVVREFAMSDGSFADYLIFIDGKACVIMLKIYLQMSALIWIMSCRFYLKAMVLRFILLICVIKKAVLDEFLHSIALIF